MIQQELKKPDLIYPELCYKIVGVLFEVFKQLGSGYQEKHYQKAVATELQKSGLKYKEQVFYPVSYKGESIGKYFLDFLIDEKVVLELKKDNGVSHKSIEQILNYLKIANLKLGLIANFTSNGVRFKRIVNL